MTYELGLRQSRTVLKAAVTGLSREPRVGEDVSVEWISSTNLPPIRPYHWSIARRSIETNRAL
jgi:hypothetical protein